MHNLLRPELSRDLGFVTDTHGSLTSAVPRFSDVDPGCGLHRDPNGDIMATGAEPTIGFLRTVNGDLEFHTI